MITGKIKRKFRYFRKWICFYQRFIYTQYLWQSRRGN